MGSDSVVPPPATLPVAPSRRLLQSLADAARGFLDSRSTAWTVGVVIPPLMLFLDPVVFRDGMMGTPLLERYRPLGYVTIALGVAALALALIRPVKPSWLAGAMLAASGFGLVLGVVLIPFSLIGILFLGVGLLGFSPLLCACVFAWWSRKTYRLATTRYRALEAWGSVLVFVLFVLGAQAMATRAFRAAVVGILAESAADKPAAIASLRRWSLLVGTEELIERWAQESDPERQKRLADAYRSVTGEDLADVMARRAD